MITFQYFPSYLEGTYLFYLFKVEKAEKGLYESFSLFTPVQCCGSGPFFSGSGSADPIFEIRIQIRIRVTQKRPDPDLDPDPTQICFFMLSKINIFLWHFLTKSKHLMTLKIKDKKLFARNCILDLNYRGLFVDKGSGSGSATLLYTMTGHAGCITIRERVN